jgi:hypothetical protein
MLHPEALHHLERAEGSANGPETDQVSSIRMQFARDVITDPCCPQLRRRRLLIDDELKRQRAVKSCHADAIQILCGSPTTCEEMANTCAPVARQRYQTALQSEPCKANPRVLHGEVVLGTDGNPVQPERAALLKLELLCNEWIAGDLAMVIGIDSTTHEIHLSSFILKAL